MSNITDTNTEFVDTLANAFLTWFQNDILPVCTAIFDLLVIIVGGVLNVLLIVTFRRMGLFSEPSTYFVLMLCIADVISYCLLLIPSVISAIAADWILSQPVCEIHGCMIFLIMFVNFGFAGVLSVERLVKLCKPDSEIYGKTFDSRTFRTTLLLAVWLISVAVGLVPLSGAAVLKFEFYHQGCMLDYRKSPSFLIVHFLLTVVLSTIVVTVSYSLIFKKRRKMLIRNRHTRIEKLSTEKSRNTTPTSAMNGSTLDPISETDTNHTVAKETESISQKSPQQKKVDKNQETRRKMKSKPRQSLLFEIFSDDQENPAFHLAITYIALWGTIMACYLPYMIVFFYGTFNDGPLWGGCYTVTLLLTHACFVVKPVVYLGHNRHYRHVTKETIPDAVKNRAQSVRDSVNTMSETLEDLIFRSNAHTKFRAALSAQKAILVWKRRWQNKKGILSLKEKPVDLNNTEVYNDKTDRTAPVLQEHAAPKSTIVTTAERTTVTPSGVSLTTNFSPSFSTSSSIYIEQERQRLLSHTKSVHWASSGADDKHNLSPVPGMVNDHGQV